MNSPYAFWMGQPVLVQVMVEAAKSTLRGVIIGESEDSLQFCLCKEGRKVLIQKSTVLAVEQEAKQEAHLGLPVDWQMPLAS